MKTKILTIQLFCIPAVLMGLFLLFYYFFQIGSLAQQQYLLGDYEEKLVSLSENNNFLDINFSKMDSFSLVDRYLDNSNFVKSDNVRYIQILEGFAASK